VKVASRSEFPLVLDMGLFTEANASSSSSHAAAAATLTFGGSGGEDHCNLSVNSPVLQPTESEEEFLQSLRHGQPGMRWLTTACDEADRIAGELLEQFGDGACFADVDEEQYEAIARHLCPYLYSHADAAATAGSGTTATGTGSNLKSHNGSSDRKDGNAHASSTVPPLSALLYQLHAVIMHTGSAHSGHYFAYIRDNLREGRWVLPGLADLRTAAAGTSATAGAAAAGCAQSIPNAWAKGTGAAATAVAVAVASPSSAPVSGENQKNSDKKCPAANSRSSASSAAEMVGATSSTSHLLYTYDSSSRSYVIDELSPLAVVLRGIQQSANAVAGNNRNAGPRVTLGSSSSNNNNNNSSNVGGAGGGKTANKGRPNSASVGVQSSAKIVDIAVVVGRLLKAPWEKIYKQKYGSIKEFAKSQVGLLEVTSANDVIIKRKNFKLVSPNAYKTALLQHVESASSGISSISFNKEMDGVHANFSASGVSSEDADAQLAVMLQQELDLDEQQQQQQMQGRPSSAMTWETTNKGGSKRNRSTKAATTTTAVPFVNEGTSSTAHLQQQQQQQQQTLSPRDARIAILASEILSHFFGNYFEFNDSSITPISLRHLERAFAGLDSAYLLVYRSMGSEAASTSVATAAVGAGAGISQPLQDLPSYQKLQEVRRKVHPDDASPEGEGEGEGVRVRDHGKEGPLVHYDPRLPRPPAHYVQEVAARNAELAAARAEYLTSFTRVSLRLHCPAHMRYDAPLLYPAQRAAATAVATSAVFEGNADSSASTALSAGTSTSKSTGDNDSSAAEQLHGDVARMHQPIEFDIDSKRTVAQLKEAFLEKYRPHASLLGLAVSTPENELSVCLLKRFGDGFYILDTCADDKRIAEVIENANNAPTSAATFASAGACASKFDKVLHLLVWDGKQLHGHSEILRGLLGYPKLLSVSWLQAQAALSPDAGSGDESGGPGAVASSSSSSSSSSSCVAPVSAALAAGVATASVTTVPRGHVRVDATELCPAWYVPSCMSLLELCQRACALCNIDPLRATVSAITTVVSAGTSSAAAAPPCYATTCVFFNGRVTGKTLLGDATSDSGGDDSGDGVAFNTMLQADAAIGEYPSLCELLVEDRESSGMLLQLANRQRAAIASHTPALFVSSTSSSGGASAGGASGGSAGSSISAFSNLSELYAWQRSHTWALLVERDFHSLGASAGAGRAPAENVAKTTGSRVSFEDQASIVHVRKWIYISLTFLNAF
jgi:hypothetical protein